MSRVAQLVEHGACDARVVGAIPIGDQYEKSMNMYEVTAASCSG